MAGYEGYGDMRFKDIWGFGLEAARNYLTECFWVDGAKWLLWADSDTVFHPGAALRMMSYDLPVVCGGMYTKGVPPKPTIGNYIGQVDEKHYYRFSGTARYTLEYFIETCGVKEVVRNDLLMEQPSDLRAVDGCGMHFTLVRRDVIEALRPGPWFMQLGRTGAGEDFYFCRKVKEAGFQIYYDVSVQTGHADGEEYDFGIRELLTCARLMGADQVAEDHDGVLVV
jgi:GT2 family glycosyltransferase